VRRASGRRRNAPRRQGGIGRVGTPDDIRDAILGFLEGSDMVTGQVLVVDGGLGIAG